MPAALLTFGVVILQGCDFLPADQNAAPSTGDAPARARRLATPTAMPGAMIATIPGEGRHFEATGQTVYQPFLAYWEQNGDMTTFGYPTTERIIERDPQSGEEYSAQYFERARFELHSITGDKVILGRLGALVHPPGPPVSPKEGFSFFEETGHNVHPLFMRFWNEHGGLPVFGYPISEVLTETNPVDGREYTVQYFERARFELHPEYAGTPFEVQLGRLGAVIYQERRLSDDED